MNNELLSGLHPRMLAKLEAIAKKRCEPPVHALEAVIKDAALRELAGGGLHFDKDTARLDFLERERGIRREDVDREMEAAMEQRI